MHIDFTIGAGAIVQSLSGAAVAFGLAYLQKKFKFRLTKGEIAKAATVAEAVLPAEAPAIAEAAKVIEAAPVGWRPA